MKIRNVDAQGFSLIELMIAIVILLVVATMFIGGGGPTRGGGPRTSRCPCCRL